MVYGELGRQPLNITVAKRVIGFWHNLTATHNQMKLSNILYTILRSNACTDNNNKLKWLKYVETILNDCGLTRVFNNPQIYNKQWLTSRVEIILTDQFIQLWNNQIQQSSKGLYYQHLKIKPEFEKYLLLSKPISVPILKFRTCNHHLPVEVGRWLGIPRLERTCSLCDSPVVADEFHYLFKCPFFNNERLLYIPNKYCKWPNMHKLRCILSTKKVKDIKNLSKFVSVVLSAVKKT